MKIIKTTRLLDQGWTPAYFTSPIDAERLFNTRKNSKKHNALLVDGVEVVDDRDSLGYGFDSRSMSTQWSNVTAAVMRLGLD